jgi:hypothetical protein
MKLTVRALVLVVGLFCVLPSKANSADIEWLGILSGFGGAERETILKQGPLRPAGVAPCFVAVCGFPGNNGVGQAGGRGSAQALGVIPLWGPVGIQTSFNYTGGAGSRFATTFGPLYDFTAGKVGLFASYQHRTQNGDNFWWVEPALDLYLDQVNISLRYLQPVSSVQNSTTAVVGDGNDILQRNMAINRVQGTASYFPPDFLSLGKDNLEITGGVQVNSFAGPHVGATGVGPVFGLSMMPFQNVELTLIRGTVDNRSRYEVQTGLRIYFGKSLPSISPATSPSLKELRRKYMEASPYPVSGHSAYRRGRS